MRSFIKEFREFISTGNVVELASAVILGAAVTTVITAFTQGIVMQFIAALVGKPDFSDVTITLRRNVGTDDAGNAVHSVLEIGTLINALINLVLVGFVLFLMIKAYNKFKNRNPVEEAVEEASASEVELLTEIRDLLAARDK